MPHFILEKMQSNLQEVVKYKLVSNKEVLEVNNLIGKKIELKYTGQINCIKCGRVTKTSFAQGLCYQCFQTAPEADVCVMQPEKCLAHEGISRDMEWAKQGCLKPHYVYLAKTSDIKIGVTRESQIPTRWIDQGADTAIKIAKTPYRQLAGLIEVFLKDFFTDKTAWQKMLKNEKTSDCLIEAKKKALDLLPDDFKKYIVRNDEVVSIHYPHEKTPVKIKSLKLDKQPIISGVLTGIKGQYLILDNEFVFNVRSHSGYNVEILTHKVPVGQQTIF